MKVIRLGLEVLPERYTEQWSRWFPNQFAHHDWLYQEIPSETLSDRVETGKVLDAGSTMYYKFGQLQRVARLFKEGVIEDGDCFFIDDVQFPGVWAIRYMAELYDVKVFIFGFLHASSYTKEDFAAPMSPFMTKVEQSWFDLYDKIFVATEYHRSAVVSRRGVPSGKIVVTGAPWSVWEAQSKAYGDSFFTGNRSNTIMFSSRFDTEKRPNVFMKLVHELVVERGIDNIQFLITTSRKNLTSNAQLWDMLVELDNKINSEGALLVRTGISKSEYYARVAQAALVVSTTIEESFGYCVAEALSLNTPVFVPDSYSHPELLSGLPREYKNNMTYRNTLSQYKDDYSLEADDNIRNLADRLLMSYDYFTRSEVDLTPIHKTMLPYNDSISNMIREMERVVTHHK